MSEFDHTGWVILVVEDEEDLRTDIVEELEAAGYRTLQAGSGRAALSILEDERPDLVLCDITMPGLDGYGVMREMRQRRPDLADVPFLFLTALAGRADVIQGKSAGADDYLVKPIDYDILLATVRARLSQVSRISSMLAGRVEDVRRDMAQAAVNASRDAVAAVAATLDRMAVGLVVVEADQTIVQANATARSILEEGEGIGQRTGKLVGTSASALKRTLAELVQSEREGESIAIERTYRRPILAQASLFSREPARMALILIDPDRQPRLSGEVATRMYGLTPTEARLALALAGGKRTDEIAGEFAIAPTTISFHLQNLFRKTQTTRQSDLVALLLRSALAADAGQPG